jgi:iron(III) transport system ATP-binding protein
MTPVLECRNIGFSYAQKRVLSDFSCQVEKGERVSLLGPSGSGKTTLLRLMAGLEKPDEGEILLRGEKVSSSQVFVPASQRKIGFVFQNFALFEKITVKQNIEYGCKTQDDQRTANKLIELMKLEKHIKKKPYQLSGGEKQKVALARSLALSPDIIFLDEPFSNIDFDQTEFLIDEIKDLFTQLSITSIMVTHSPEESKRFSTRVIQF